LQAEIKVLGRAPIAIYVNAAGPSFGYSRCVERCYLCDASGKRNDEVVRHHGLMITVSATRRTFGEDEVTGEPRSSLHALRTPPFVPLNSVRAQNTTCWYSRGNSARRRRGSLAIDRQRPALDR